MDDVQIHLNAAVLFSIIGALLCALMVGGWAVVWAAIKRLEGKLDKLNGVCSSRIVECLKVFTSDEDFVDWKKGRVDIWRAINKHAHVNGKVVRED